MSDKSPEPSLRNCKKVTVALLTGSDQYDLEIISKKVSVFASNGQTKNL